MNLGALTYNELYFIYISVCCSTLPLPNGVDKDALQLRLEEMIDHNFTSVVVSVEAV